MRWRARLAQPPGVMSKISATALKIGIASFWGAVFVAAFATTTPKPWALTIAGIGLGCLSGHIRSRAIRAGKAAGTANALAWLCGTGLMVLAMAFAENMFMSAWAASFAAYWLFDRALSIPASCRKNRAPPGAAADGT
jgi:hypothetical protein